MPGKEPGFAGPNFRLETNRPAYLEVTIDPAAHGDRGLGPVRRGVNLQTSSGQTFSFELMAQVIR